MTEANDIKQPTAENDKLQSFLLKYGSNPKLSYKRFALGLFLFFTGLVLIYLGAATLHLLQLPAVVLMAVGVFISLRGYLGILCNRLAYFRHNSAKKGAKYKHLE